MTDLHQRISDLETEIDVLSDAAEHCRKSMVVAKAAVGVGALLFVASFLGLLRSDAIILVIGIASALAGTVFYGSSRSSLEAIAAKIRVCEARRTQMIDELNLRAIEEP